MKMFEMWVRDRKLTDIHTMNHPREENTEGATMPEMCIRELQIKDREIIEVQQECDKSKFEKILDKFLYIFLVIAFIVLIQFFIKIFK